MTFKKPSLALLVAFGFAGIASSPAAMASVTVTNSPSSETGSGVLIKARADVRGSFISCSSDVFTDSRKDAIRCVAHDENDVTASCWTVRGASNVNDARFERMRLVISGITRMSRVAFQSNAAGQCTRVVVHHSANDLR